MQSASERWMSLSSADLMGTLLPVPTFFAQAPEGTDAPGTPVVDLSGS